MSLFLNENKMFVFDKEKYSDFKTNLKEVLNEFSNFKNIDYRDNFKDLFNMEKEKENELLYEYLFYINYSKMIILNIDLNFCKNEMILNELNKFAMYADKNYYYKDKFKFFFHVHLFLLVKLEKIIFNVIHNSNMKEINQLYHILMQIFMIMLKLYKEKIYSISHIFLFLDSIIIFINKNRIIYDKYINLKNMILFEILFGKYLSNTAFILLNNQSENKEDIDLFFDYLIKILKKDELKTHFNFLILSKTKVVHKLMEVILYNFDYNKNIDIYNKYKKDMISCMANIYKNNSEQKNFFQILINQNKKSFINLANYQTKKELIINDLYSKNFYIELLLELFNIEKAKFNPKNPSFDVLPPENSFIFNGYSSKMTIQLNKFSLDNSILFLSFQLNNILINDNNNNFPLIKFDALLPTEISFKIFIKKVNDNYRLMIHQEKKSEKKSKILHLDKIENIIPNVNYYLGIRFMDRKISIQVKKVDIKTEKNYEQEEEIYSFKFQSAAMRLGHDDKTNEYFKGYIGSIIIINNLSVKKNANLGSVITSTLALKDYYKFFPYISHKSEEFEFDIGNYLYFSHFKIENEVKAIINFIQNTIENYNCSLYITPEIMTLYHSFMENLLVLPEIPIVSESQNCDVISEFNVSMTKLNLVYIEFQKNNGFDLFSLVFEYFYQFFTLMSMEENKLNTYFHKDLRETIIIKTLNSAFLILGNYNDYKIITNNLKSFKTLYRNIFETLKQIKKISNKIIQNISKSLYELFFGFKNEQIEFLKELYKKIPSNIIDIKKSKEMITDFVDSLIDMIYDSELYINYEKNDYINMLFMLSRSFVMNYLDDKNKKDPPFRPEFFFNILNFIKIIEKEFDNDFMKKNKTIDSLFNLLKCFFETIKEENNCMYYFRKLLPFSIINYENNLSVSYRFLTFINELLWKKYSLESEDIELLVNYKNKLAEKSNDENNKKLIEEINSVIVSILIKIYFFNISDSSIIQLNIKLEEYINTENILSNTIFELKNIFAKLIKFGVGETKTSIKSSKSINSDINININYMNLFWQLFDFIIKIFKLMISKCENASNKEEEEENEDDISDRSFQNLFSLLDQVTEILKIEFKENKYIYKIYCIINFLKFYHYIIFNEIIIFEISNKKNFVDNLLKIIELCSESCILNCNQFLKIKIGNKEVNKTLIEIIFELYMKYIFNSNDSIECFKILLLKFNDIFYDKEFKSEGKCSIFYANDYLKYLFYQKKIKEKTESILKKYKIVQMYNGFVFQNEEKFDLNFTTYFLSLLIENEIQIKNENNLDKKLAPRLINFMNQLFVDILQEHKNLYNIEKKYFFKASSFPSYTEQINYIRDKYIKKNIPPEEVKNYFEKIIQNKTVVEEKEEGNIIEENQNNQTESKDQLILEKKNSINSIKNNTFEFPKDKNNIPFFNVLDEKYVWNVKKEIMNNIFSLYYIDELFYNADFCVIKKYYINYINQNPFNNSKQLDFPSIIKNYRNNFESSIFVKQYNDFFTDPFLPITHNYIKDELETKISRKKSIKLIQKNFPISQGDKQIECELLKNENTYYGKLNYNDSEEYFLFKEEFKEYKEEDGYKYIFLMNCYWNSQNREKKKREKFLKKNFKKNVLILLDDIEEIIEMRIFLLWKGFEIYVKNGKSYLFNFLNTNEYETFMKSFLYKSKIKHLIRKRDFLTEKSNIYKDWKAGLISNQDYILLLNRYSSRSFNDPTQYPIFPWLLYDYKNLESFNSNEQYFLSFLKRYLQLKDENEEIFADSRMGNVNNNDIRDLIIYEKYDKIEEIFAEPKKKKLLNFEQSFALLKDILTNVKKQLRDFLYPPSLQTIETREIAKNKYREDKEDGNSFPQHCGVHYSTSAYIYFYLMRQQPYNNLLVRLQEFNLENTNRCFSSFLIIQAVRMSGSDNRELIPDFCSKIEYFLNLNCDFYGILDVKKINLDDVELDIFGSKNTTLLSKYVKFILQHKKLLNSKLIGYYLNQWIDIIFGVNQLPPEKTRYDSCNIFPKICYEQKNNLEEKLKKKKAQENLTQIDIITKINLRLSQLINFGIVPAQLFRYPHEQLNLSTKIDINGKRSDKNNEKDIFDSNEEDENDDIESIILKNVRSENLSIKIRQKGEPLYFMINSTINKIFIYNEKDNIILYDCQLYNEINSKFFAITDLYYAMKKSNILYINERSIYQIKYGFSSFNKEISYNDSNLNEENDYKYHTYYYQKINYLINKKNIKEINSPSENFFLITCRHIDSSFQIHYFKLKIKRDKREIIKKTFSFFCEDFISCCCCVSNNSFILGLKNGKLIYYKMNLINFNRPEKQEKNKQILKEKINLKILKYIQDHDKKINTIEIDKRLGVFMTSGDDNYIFIRKLYDFELLLPIKIKNKYRILMTKTSSYNFFYVLCFNKTKKKNIIFGYTFSGIKFAKSEYGLYDNININEDGNLITIEDKKQIIFLSGSDLTKLNIYEDKLKGIKFFNWLQYDCFLRKDEEKMSKIITYLNGQKDSSNINTLSLSNS